MAALRGPLGTYERRKEAPLQDPESDAGTATSKHHADLNGFATTRPGAGGGAPESPLLAELQVQERYFQRLFQVLERISRGTGLEDILHFVYEEFRGDIPFDRISFATIDAATGQLVARWARSQGKLQIAPGYARELAGSGLSELLVTGRPRIIDDHAVHLRRNPRSEGTLRLLTEGLRSSLTCPLVVEGRPIGFLFFNSRRPRAYTESHVRFLCQLSAILALLIERGRLFDELREERANVERQRLLLSEDNRRYREDLELAQKVQRALIRGGLPKGGRLDSAMLYEPAAMIGGDLVDCIGLGGDSAIVYVADVLGHGVPAALVMSVVRTAFHGALAAQQEPGRPSPATLLDGVNRALVEMLDSQFVTVACARVDSDTRTVTLALAGHPPVFVLRRGTGVVDEVAARHIPMGIFPTTAYANVEVAFEPGDVLLLYTDGVVEAEDPDEDPFGRDRLRTVVEGLGQGSIGELVADIRKALDHHVQGVALVDDITLLAVQL